MTDLATLTPPPLAGAARLADPVRRLMNTELTDGPSDGQLLDRFVACRDHQAFASLVGRHGPMVLGVCRRVVGNLHDADDAFQATFLVLVRRAESIRPRDMVRPWLYGVAYRTALTARHRVVRCLSREKSLDESMHLAVTPQESGEGWLELDHAIHRLPEIYRWPVVLCELQGRPRREAARLLGVAEGTLSSRLAAARKRLARQLNKRGVLGLVTAGSVVFFPHPSPAAVSPALTASTLQCADAVLNPTSMKLPAAVAQLSQGAIRSMFFTKCNSLLASAILVGCLGGGAALLAGPVENPADPQAQQDRPGRSGEQDKRGTRQGERPGKAQAKHDADENKHSHHEVIEGSGNIVTETRKISGVSSIAFLTAGKVTIKQTGREALTLKGDDNILKLVDSQVADGALTLGMNRKDVSFKPTQEVEFIIEVKTLTQVDQKGAGELKVVDVNGKELSVNLMGAGSVTLSGKTVSLKLHLGGAGNINADGLTARDAVVHLQGAGNVRVNASATLDVNLQGVGNVEYLGSPEVKKSVKGIGNVGPAGKKKSGIAA